MAPLTRIKIIEKTIIKKLWAWSQLGSINF